ncbi:hypothetical protein E1288_17325 [Saccharopolyspora elongata]|uniref:Uncharacterized protein n=1 Tax=Saccharopolyspora elongata TaxID=2530387 RepID=A0A4R4Z2Q3_9PSEU|nr:hypothetical protein E1288_17325 [Saccharopolyspora elongata]
MPKPTIVLDIDNYADEGVLPPAVWADSGHEQDPDASGLAQRAGAMLEGSSLLHHYLDDESLH